MIVREALQRAQAAGGGERGRGGDGVGVGGWLRRCPGGLLGGGVVCQGEALVAVEGGRVHRQSAAARGDFGGERVAHLVARSHAPGCGEGGLAKSSERPIQRCCGNRPKWELGSSPTASARVSGRIGVHSDDLVWFAELIKRGL